MEVVKRYFVAQHESILSKETLNNRQSHSNSQEEKKQKVALGQYNTNRYNVTSSSQNKRQTVDQDPTRGLARLGSRAALSFAFKFLRRAWRSGEDADLCSDILYESLDALQVNISYSFYSSYGPYLI